MKYKFLKYCKKNKHKTIETLYLLKKLNLFFLFKEPTKKIIESILKIRNTFVYIKANGTKLFNPRVKNLTLNIKGFNNHIEINELKITKRFKINISGDNNKISIGQKGFVQELDVYMERNSELRIGDNFSIRRGVITLTGDYNNKILIGNDCMFSYDLIVRTSDMHIIYDNTTKELLNPGKDIVIGNHVWIAAKAMIMKGVQIADNCIIGAGSIVTRKFSTPNCIIAGNPAKIIKENINWNISRIHRFDKIKDSLID